MKILVTNLKTSTERKKHIMDQFKDKSLEYSFVDCVIGKDLSEEELDQKCDMNKIASYNREVEWFTRGVIGCTLTNQNTYRSMIENKDEMVLLLEDDTIIPPNLKEILDEVESKIVQGDVVLLFYLTYDTLKLKRLDNSKVAPFFIPINPEVLHGGSAVIVTLRAAEKMLKHNTPIRMTPDSWKEFYDNKCIDRLICMHPQPVKTADFGTTMGYVKDSMMRKVLYSNPLTRFMLKLKRKIYKLTKQKVIVVD